MGRMAPQHMADPARFERLGAGFALAGFFFFATHDAVIKDLGTRYATLQLIFFITLMAFVPATLTVLWRVGIGGLVANHPVLLGVRCLMIIGAVNCGFYAFTSLPLAEAYVLVFAAPLIMTLLAVPMLGEKVGIRRLSATIMGFCGVLVVLRPGVEALSLGHLAALGTAFFGAGTGLIVRKIGRDEKLSAMILYPMVANMIAAGFFVPGLYRPMAVPDLGMMLAAAGLFTSAQIMIVFAFRRAPAATVAPIQYSQIVWAVLFGAIFFGETPDIWVAVGAAIVIGSGLYIVFRESQLRAVSARPVSTAPRGEAVPQMGGRQPPDATPPA